MYNVSSKWLWVGISIQMFPLADLTQAGNQGAGLERAMGGLKLQDYPSCWPVKAVSPKITYMIYSVQKGKENKN